MNKFKNKRVVIAGGTSGIGLATAAILADSGAEVIITGRDAAKLQLAVSQTGASTQSATVDATDRTQLDRYFSAVGTFDHLVITLSGGKGAGTFRELALQQLRSGFEGKFWPQLNCLQAALPFLNPAGSVTLVTAVSATSRKPGFSGLAAINGALEAMIPVLAKEFRPLRINAVSPGVIDTSWWDSFPAAVKESLFTQFTAEIPAARIGRADDVAQAIVFLIQCGYITGRILPVDGGFGL